MKLSPWLAIALFISTCSDRHAGEQQAAAPQPEPAATGVARAGDERVPAPAPPARRVVEPIEVSDARAAAVGPITQAATQAGVNSDTAVLQDFTARVDEYLKIHKEAAKGPAKLKEAAEPAEITKAQDALAARIITLRADATDGDIFTAEISTRFRRLLAPEMKGEDGRDAKAMIKDDAPAPASIPFKVNAKYPEGQPLPTVPSNVLLNLPRLPKPVEYRIIGRHLVLLDADANIVVDYIPNVIK